MTRIEFVQSYGSVNFFMDCDKCDHDTHRCYFCGESLIHGSWEVHTIYNHYKMRKEVLLVPHWLSDCRPDLMDGTYDGSKMGDGPLG